MKISAQEEYGLRILSRIAQCPVAEGITIPEISRLEGISHHNVAKLCRLLRLAGLVKSSRGNVGGYSLAKSAKNILLSDVLAVLGGRLFDEGFCGNHAGVLNLCTNSVDCAIRSLWQVIQVNIDHVLDNITLQSLLAPANQLHNLPFQKHTQFIQLQK